MDLNSSKQNRINYIFIGMSILCLCINLFKARYTLGYSDEHFYITEGYRLLLGDKLFFDDWHIAQMISVFIAPLVGFYHLINSNNEGIVLFMRIAYSVFNLIVGIVLYCRFRKQFKSLYLVLGIALYYLFTPFNIMALSYNTMSVGFLLLALSFYPYKKQKVYLTVLSGIFYGCAVINTPYLALGYFVLLIYLLISKQLNVKDYLNFSIGIGIVAIGFLTFVFSNISLEQLQIGVSHFIDPSHSDGVLKTFIKNGGRLIMDYHIGFVGLLGLVVLPFLGKNKKYNSVTVLIGITLLMAIYIGFIRPKNIELGGYVEILIPYCLLGIALQLYYTQSFELKLMYWASIFHALMISMSSNVGPRSFSGPLIAACISTTLMLAKVEENRLVKLGIVIGMALTLGYFKVFSYYGETRSFDVVAEKGPCKGLYDSSEAVDYYQELLEDVEEIEAQGEKYVVFISDQSWPYLATNKRVGANSTYMYFWYKEQYLECLDDYFRVHPEKDTLIYLDSINPYDMDKDDSWLKDKNYIQGLRHGILFRR